MKDCYATSYGKQRERNDLIIISNFITFSFVQRSDPSPIFNGWGPSGRGVSYTFGEDIVKVF